jgi:peptidoglycan/LPS O-acetylase OafA/YrhL
VIRDVGSRAGQAAVTAQSDTGRLAGIEGLRAVAALSILFYHCWLFSSASHAGWNIGPLTVFVPPLQSGVTLFFVLSGFLLYRPIAGRVLHALPRAGTGRYLWRRTLRILPAYWCVLLVSALVLESAIIGRAPHGFLIGTRPEWDVLAKDMLLVGNYAPSTLWTGVLPAWSLSVEVVFYLLLPMLAVLAHAVAGRRGSALARAVATFVPVVLLFAVSVAGKLLAMFAEPGGARSQASDWHTVIDRSFVTHADLFAFGMLIAILCVYWESGGTRLVSFVSGGVNGRILLYAGVPFTVLGYYLLSGYVYDSGVGFFLSLLVARMIVHGQLRRRGGFLEHPITVKLGLISYSIFLWNYPVLTFLKAHGALVAPAGAVAVAGNTMLAVPIVLLLSLATYRLVEAPFLRLKSLPSRHPPMPLAVAEPS